MATAVHHVSVLCPDDRLGVFLRDVLTMAEATPVVIDPLDGGPMLDSPEIVKARSTMLGTASHGLVEVVEISTFAAAPPPPRHNRPEVSLAFSVRDLNGTCGRAKSLGFGWSMQPQELSFNGIRVRMATWEFGPVAIQLTEILSSDSSP